MTPPTAAPTGHSAPASYRADLRDEPWPARPWIMAAICALAGLVFQHLGRFYQAGDPGATEAAAATFVAIATVSLVLTVERRRWWWAVAFALGWGAITGLVGLSTQGYSRISTIFEWPFLSGLLAVGLAAPLFQAVRDDWDRGERVVFDPVRVHGHAWTDAVIGAAAIGFVGVAFALAWLIAGLFNIIGIRFLRDLLSGAWFPWMLSGFAFGAAIGLLRERDALVGTMQRLVMIVLGVLAPVLAAALALFLLSLPVTGLSGLWNSWVSAAGLTLAASAGAYLLLNAALGLGEEDRPVNAVLSWSALVLALAVLPLAILAMAALGLRVGQYGWTPERLWGVICAGIAIAFGIGGWWAVWRGRIDFARPIRLAQTWLALGVCIVALFLALPLVDFGAISTRDQIARLERGDVTPSQFDWTAMAFDFGPSGRRALERLARSGPEDVRPRARTALTATNRYSLDFVTAAGGDAEPLERRLRVVPQDRPLPSDALDFLRGMPVCRTGPCVVLWVDADRIAAIGTRSRNDRDAQVEYIRRGEGGEWSFGADVPRPAATEPQTPPDLGGARVELRDVRRRQIFIDGEPIGPVIE